MSIVFMVSVFLNQRTKIEYPIKSQVLAVKQGSGKIPHTNLEDWQESLPSIQVSNWGKKSPEDKVKP